MLTRARVTRPTPRKPLGRPRRISGGPREWPGRRRSPIGASRGLSVRLFRSWPDYPHLFDAVETAPPDLTPPGDAASVEWNLKRILQILQSAAYGGSRP
jgi:hypothetical protein